MKKMLLAFTLLFSVAFVPSAYADTAKEGSDTITWSYVATPLTSDIVVDKAGSAGVLEVLGVVLSDTGEGPFHNLSTRDVVFWRFEDRIHRGNFVGLRRMGYSLWTDLDGDQSFIEGKLDPSRDTNAMRFMGGSGKFAGMEVRIEEIGDPIKLKSLKEGVTSGVRQFQIHWKLL